MSALELSLITEIDFLATEYPWSIERFSIFRAWQSTECWTMTLDQVPIGFVCAWRRHRYQMLARFAVYPTCQRFGYGSFMFSRLWHLGEREGGEWHAALRTIVSERDDGTIAFLLACEFRGLSVMHDYFGPGHDGYEMLADPDQVYRPDLVCEEDDDRLRSLTMPRVGVRG